MIGERRGKRSQRSLCVEIKLDGKHLAYEIIGPLAAPEALSWVLKEIAKNLEGG